ncbi:hypothetical protein TREMEDRAFT_60642 [Tremella mesenterica DSM 1558]|uniref:uncharacterized protein n=1 Tax=Tremella mesenterica (strain ATCC 24925 / CBS 8224 / DSM 1558 / NBRC 9311 / NRRL Y-6157 / RJB 2259-6 / UBC 559-6) TaxID=578456 RepID=UPI0003F49E1E|nr:uncharacterized protein TREMEDRAFT_60642 [Tremella mesenterica DSM 1558]EIW71726.1 hypothetical protein TREMEDRAFT_60642 [Tremella mesenterica DSM 1558]
MSDPIPPVHPPPTFKLPPNPSLPQDVSLIMEMVAQQVVSPLPPLGMSASEKRKLVEESLRRKNNSTKVSDPSKTAESSSPSARSTQLDPIVDVTQEPEVNDDEDDSSDSSSEWESSDDEEEEKENGSTILEMHDKMKQELDQFVNGHSQTSIEKLKEEKEAETDSEYESGDESDTGMLDHVIPSEMTGRELELEEDEEVAGPIASVNEEVLPVVAQPPLEKLPKGEGLSLAGEVVSWMKDRKAEAWAESREQKQETSVRQEGKGIVKIEFKDMEEAVIIQSAGDDESGGTHMVNEVEQLETTDEIQVDIHDHQEMDLRKEDEAAVLEMVIHSDTPSVEPQAGPYIKSTDHWEPSTQNIHPISDNSLSPTTTDMALASTIPPIVNPSPVSDILDQPPAHASTEIPAAHLPKLEIDDNPPADLSLAVKTESPTEHNMQNETDALVLSGVPKKANAQATKVVAHTDTTPVIEDMPKLSSAGTVVIRAMQSRPGAHDEGWLEEGSVLCWEDGRVLGTVSETFGPLTSPFYTVRLPPPPYPYPPLHSLNAGTKLFYPTTPIYRTFVNMPLLRDPRLKGSDASNRYDEEVGEDELEWSDDEAEAEAKKRRKRGMSSRFSDASFDNNNLQREGVERGGRNRSRSGSVSSIYTANRSDGERGKKRLGGVGGGRGGGERERFGLPTKPHFDYQPEDRSDIASMYGDEIDGSSSERERRLPGPYDDVYMGESITELSSMSNEKNLSNTGKSDGGSRTSRDGHSNRGMNRGRGRSGGRESGRRGGRGGRGGHLQDSPIRMGDLLSNPSQPYLPSFPSPHHPPSPFPHHPPSPSYQPQNPISHPQNSISLPHPQQTFPPFVQSQYPNPNPQPPQRSDHSQSTPFHNPPSPSPRNTNAYPQPISSYVPPNGPGHGPGYSQPSFQGHDQHHHPQYQMQQNYQPQQYQTYQPSSPHHIQPQPSLTYLQPHQSSQIPFQSHQSQQIHPQFHQVSQIQPQPQSHHSRMYENPQSQQPHQTRSTQDDVVPAINPRFALQYQMMLGQMLPGQSWSPR